MVFSFGVWRFCFILSPNSAVFGWQHKLNTIKQQGSISRAETDSAHWHLMQVPAFVWDSDREKSCTYWSDVSEKLKVPRCCSFCLWNGFAQWLTVIAGKTYAAAAVQLQMLWAMNVFHMSRWEINHQSFSHHVIYTCAIWYSQVVKVTIINPVLRHCCHIWMKKKARSS